MTTEYIYNPARPLSGWQRFQAHIWSKYGVNGAELVATCVAGFVGFAVLGAVAIAQM
ncbi:hypothetical protein [Agrobacterium tumefaciens]|uniref:hypothetical protein n=1 Tax=Agrobacterium tumefaciens TaxID=358 RepID=UPI000AB34F10|nr:hypothetical protein [Agrobacterium tumefaciens]